MPGNRMNTTAVSGSRWRIGLTLGSAFLLGGQLGNLMATGQPNLIHLVSTVVLSALLLPLMVHAPEVRFTADSVVFTPARGFPERRLLLSEIDVSRSRRRTFLDHVLLRWVVRDSNGAGMSLSLFEFSPDAVRTVRSRLGLGIEHHAH